MRKKALLLIFTINCLIVFAQKKTIKGYFVDAQTQKGKYQPFILLHQDSLVYKGESDMDKGFKIKGLNEGQYKIKFENRFRQTFEKIITVEKKNVNNLIIPVERFNYEEKQPDYNTIDIEMPSELLSLGDSIQYVFYSSGCFHNSLVGITISKDSTSFKAKYWVKNPRQNREITGRGFTSYVFNSLDSLVSVKVLSIQEIESFRRFEQEFWKVFRIQIDEGKLYGCRSSTTMNLFCYKGEKGIAQYEICVGDPENTFLKWKTITFEEK